MMSLFIEKSPMLSHRIGHATPRNPSHQSRDTAQPIASVTRHRATHRISHATPRKPIASVTRHRATHRIGHATPRNPSHRSRDTAQTHRISHATPRTHQPIIYVIISTWVYMFIHLFSLFEPLKREKLLNK
jgi:hypothetical protein